MPAPTETSEPFVLDRWPEASDGINDLVGDFTDVLLPALSPDKQHTREQVAENLGRVIGSPNTSLFVITMGGHVISTATLNANPVLSNSGVENWIDDVVTDPNRLKQGHSKRIMDKMEAQAALTGGYVFLTSSPDRGPARTGYEKRGYRLLNEAGQAFVVFRNTSLGNIAMDSSEIEILGPKDVTRGRALEISEYLGESPRALETNLRRAVNSPTTTVISHSRTGGIATVNQTPIPVGMKPWITDLGCLLEWGEQPLLDAGGVIVRDKYGFGFANHIAPPDNDFGIGWFKRESGLYLKTFNSGGGSSGN